MLKDREKNKGLAAAKSGMDIKTARKYEHLGRLPSEVKKPHSWRTREDPFEDDWDEVKGFLEMNPGLEAKTLFVYLQNKKPGKYSDGQLRTLQRHIRQWQSEYGPEKEVFFAQNYIPGERCQSDYTNMNKLDITIGHTKFNHLIYHFVLPFSNWETGSICYSESFESLSDGFQKALWDLGAVPSMHQTDSLSAAVNNNLSKKDFTARYKALLGHYKIEGRHTGAGKGNENGDVEQSHHRFKRAVDQALMMRGSRDFNSLEEYNVFLKKIFDGRNKPRARRFGEELKAMRKLPLKRFEAIVQIDVKVGPGSTIRVRKNTYSVPARLIGQRVKVRLYADHIEVWHAQKCVERIARMRGEEKHFINYRHIIGHLVRKVGAFAHYRYHKDLFPSHAFRLLYDHLKKEKPLRADKIYLSILHLAATENETAVAAIVKGLLDDDVREITCEVVARRLSDYLTPQGVREVKIMDVNLSAYDVLLNGAGNLLSGKEGAL